jgi:CheY-like chemotaxis protein
MESGKTGGDTGLSAPTGDGATGHWHGGGEKTRARIDAISALLYELNNPLQILLTLAEMDQNKEYSRQVARIVHVLDRMKKDASLDMVVGKNGGMRYREPEIAEVKAADKARILIADDEAMVRKVFSGAIARAMPGIAIDEAENGRQAVDLFEQYHHGVIVIDVVMPGMTGEESFRAIRAGCEAKCWQMPPFIFCTGFKVTPSLKALVGDSGVHLCLTKPLSVADLIGAVKGRLAR